MNKLIIIILSILRAVKKVLKKSQLDNKFFEWWVNNYLYPFLVKERKNIVDYWKRQQLLFPNKLNNNFRIEESQIALNKKVLSHSLPSFITDKIKERLINNASPKVFCNWLIKNYNKHF